ncbi:unnamed protein product [Schistosoma mattheei]|uniref:Uncharacterized protein n=1 Tax=Schistosoma mattheei TaxID=31246 RepID=A0A3P8IV74_9TREM|nr:unnamed protein product [Schistosoma mattheei]
MNASWTTTMASFKGASAIIWPRRRKCPIYTRSCIDTVQASSKCTYGMGISWTKDHQRLLKNKERRHCNERQPMLCAYERLQ